MPIIINNLNISLDEDYDELKIKVAKKLKISNKYIKNFKILKESIDARKKNNIKLNYSVKVICENEKKIVSKLKNKDIKIEEKNLTEKLICGTKKMETRPIIVGIGPAGMFAGLLLAENGYKPLIIERGEKIEERTLTVNKFWNTRKLDAESNVQFGEGGAGTFSDGKLTTRIKDKKCQFILDTFVKYGAPEEIIYSGKPHIGTDNLKIVVKNIRNRILELGGEILFKSKLEDLIIAHKKLKAVVVNGSQISCDNLILAIGHSSRDTYEMIYKRDVFMEPKAFAIGVRVEHSQHMIDVNQYGKFAGHPKLKAADYRLVYKSKEGRGVYSFCMCPGGEVVAAASEEGRLVTNGMSYYNRASNNANSAVVVTVGEKDFSGDSPLRGIEFQRYYENLAYNTGGGNYIAPVQLIKDFLEDKVSHKLEDVKPTYKPGYEFRDLNLCLPEKVALSLKEGFMDFERKIKGFSQGDGVMIGIETRTSAPVKIVRNANLESISVKGLYPCGEGAGFAGGIVSAAVDGLKVAENIIKAYSNLDI
ncbi:NAD(P)/FAD-dependent oxidoreductase [Clostridium sp. BJN0013]|uniref:NAD(P)/FAD-dependent oxidoreductase n=1 Tax=Clostridium sp. BJN0013 TaxID=3236840 RepID=UPI0034C62121